MSKVILAVGATEADARKAIGIAAGGAVTGSTGAGSAHNHGVTQGTHDHGGVTAATTVTLPAHFGALAAPGVAYHAPFAGGSGPIVPGPMDVYTHFYPRRGVQVTGTAGVVALNVTIHISDTPGNVYSITLPYPGGSTTVMDANPITGDVVSVATDVDPGAGESITVETNQDFGTGSVMTPAAVGVDGVLEAPVATYVGTGGVRPTTVPNGTHVFDTLYTANHTHGVSGGLASVTVDAESAHTHGAGTLTT